MSVLFGRISVYSICKRKSKWEISLPNSKYYCSTFRAVKSDENGQSLQYYTEFKKLVKAQNVMCKDGYTCFHVSCKICLNNEHTWAYINKRTGSFICPNCDVILPLYVAKDAYENKKKVVERKANLIEAYNTKCKNLKPIEIDVCKNLQIKGLTPTDFELIQAGHDEALNILYFPLKDANGRVVGEKWLSLRDFTEETHQSNMCSGILVHGDPTKQKAVLVSNILDFLALIAARIVKYCVVCLPYGLKTLPQECLPNLEHFKELVLWYKYDSPSWGAAKAFAAKLDEQRCQLIKPTDTEPCPYEALRKNLNIQHILQRATPVRHHSITTFSSLRNDILCELQNIEKVHGVKWKRFPILNKLLKGHRKGELTIITGPTGSGKTTFMSEYSLDLALQGVSTLWGSFEIRNSRLAATLLRQFVGYSLEKKLNEFDRWSTEFEKYPMFFMTFHGQQPLKVVLDAIEHAHYVHDINHVIIDNLQFMMGISNTYRTDKFWEQDNIVAAFRSLATKRNVHVTLVMHPRKERDEEDLTTNSIFGSAKASQEADNVLIIQDKRLTSLRGKKYLQVVKNRYSGDLGIMPLEFNKEALSYAQSGSKKRKDKDKESTKLIENLTISVT